MHIHSIEELQQLVSFLGFNSVYYLFLVCICRPILDMLEWFLGYCVCVSTSYYMPTAFTALVLGCFTPSGLMQ